MTADVCQQCVGGDVPLEEVLRLPAASYFFHGECGLRMALGGIGHLTDHAYWCGQMGDPDMGLSYRESALRVAEWIREHGTEAAAAVGSDRP